jgi:hypothetical protein
MHIVPELAVERRKYSATFDSENGGLAGRRSVVGAPDWRGPAVRVRLAS